MFEIRIARSLAESRTPRIARTPDIRRVYQLPRDPRPVRQGGPR